MEGLVQQSGIEEVKVDGMQLGVHYDTEQVVQKNVVDLQQPVQMSDQFNKTKQTPNEKLKPTVYLRCKAENPRYQLADIVLGF